MLKQTDITQYASCLLIDHDMKRALLIEKNRPDFQVGRLNIVGGHVEFGETWAQCAVREVGEEVGIELDPANIRYYCKLYNFLYRWVVHFHVAFCDIDSYEQKTDEKPVIIDLEKIPEKCLFNLKWIIPLALDNAECYAEVECVKNWTP